jgi:hypothetical protein
MVLKLQGTIISECPSSIWYHQVQVQAGGLFHFSIEVMKSERSVKRRIGGRETAWE